jgi:3-hydroxybutyryl-CoA dehydratase
MIKREYDDIQIGEKTTFTKTITEADIFAFTGISGDFNPLHVDAEFGKNSRFQGRIAHGMLVAGLVGQTLTALVGLGSVHVSESVAFKAPVKIGDTITVESILTEKIEEKRRLIIASTWTNQDGTVVITGKAEILLPR